MCVYVIAAIKNEAEIPEKEAKDRHKAAWDGISIDFLYNRYFWGLLAISLTLKLLM